MIMKHILFLSVIFLLLTGCNLAEVENPNVSDEIYISTPQAAASWVNGARRQVSITTNTMMEFTELVSDNYFNNRTLSSKVFDIPQIDFFDIDVDRVQSALHRLRATAEFGLNDVLPNDAESTAEDEATLRLYLGLAHVWMGEYFVGLPAEELGPVRTDAEHLQIAIQQFLQVQSLSDNPELVLAAQIGEARANYRLGNQSAAVAAAQAVIAADPMVYYQALYDGVNDLTNQFQFYLFDSPRDEFAPLPRLDFLDPKYFHTGNPSLEQSAVSLFKGEEAYLILAEAQCADGSLGDAKATLNELLTTVIANRPTATFSDAMENRDGGNRDDYPLTADFKVKFSENAPEREGFVLDRQAGPITVATVSGTSVTAEQINAATTTDELLVIVYLMRQEIFISEGRRQADLGIKFPISENEANNNPNVTDDFLTAQIPDFIPGDFGMDNFFNDTTNMVVTMLFDMNTIIVENKTSPFVAPFE